MTFIKKNIGYNSKKAVRSQQKREPKKPTSSLQFWGYKMSVDNNFVIIKYKI